MNTNALSNLATNAADIELGDDILGINGPVDIPNGWEWLWWTLAAIALIVLLVWLGRLLLRRIKVVRTRPPELVPPHTIARRKLADAMKWIDDPYRFCIAVSDALREYLEARFELHAPGRTTDEFLDELRDDDSLKPAQKDLLADFLTQCDLVKFAKDEPSRAQLEMLHGAAVKLVEETVPSEPPASTPAQATEVRS